MFSFHKKYTLKLFRLNYFCTLLKTTNLDEKSLALAKSIKVTEACANVKL
jgi:hypothetical protein